MNWEIIKLIYKAESPMHIGYHKLGFIQRTRYYIPGKALWGAITANLTRSIGVYRDYKVFGEEIEKKIKTTYFYPSLDRLGEDVLLPAYSDEGLRYGKDYSQSDFERIFISSYGQTAIEASNNTAEEKSLHETEYVSHQVKIDDEIKDVYFVGYVFIQKGFSLKNRKLENEKINWNNLREIIKEIFIGGERKYGMGRLNLVNEFKQGGKEKVFGKEVQVKNDNISFNLNVGDSIISHLETEYNSLKIKGDIEPLVGRKYGEIEKDGKKHIGFGQDISKAKICWVPGSIIQEDINLKLSEYGILSIIRG